MEGNVYVSLDEGKTFKVADGVPKGEVVMVFEHPTDNRYVSSARGGGSKLTPWTGVCAHRRHHALPHRRQRADMATIRRPTAAGLGGETFIIPF